MHRDTLRQLYFDIDTLPVDARAQHLFRQLLVRAARVDGMPILEREERIRFASGSVGCQSFAVHCSGPFGGAVQVSRRQARRDIEDAIQSGQKHASSVPAKEDDSMLDERE